MKPDRSLAIAMGVLLLLAAHHSFGATFNIAAGDVAGLVSAINTANGNNQDDTVNLASGSIYLLTAVNNVDSAWGPSGLPVIQGDPNHKLTINGNGAKLERDVSAGTPDFRVLLISDLTNLIDVVINDLTIANGRATGQTGRGAGIGIQGSNGGSRVVVTLNNCTLTNNSSDLVGGAIETIEAEVISQNCTFTGNTAQSGLAIYNTNNATAVFHNCTVSEHAGLNVAIFNFAIQGYFAFCEIDNTILDDPFGTVSGNRTITSNGNNLVSDGGDGFFTAAGDMINTDPHLDPAGLHDNGGPTPTIALLPDSPAINAGNDALARARDQRKYLRDGVSDIGSFEVDGMSGLAVTTTADHDDGVCNDDDCTLREAINAVNTALTPNLIVFANGLTGSIQLSGALPTLARNMSLQGPGADLLTVRGIAAGSVFIVGNGTLSGPSVNISGLTLTNGRGSGGYGGGVNSDHSNVTISACALTGNQADQGGGGVFNDAGTLLTQNCTFNNNTAAFGGGLYSRAITSGAAATATAKNCTFISNSATDNGSTGYGGALLNLAASSGSATLTVLNCTVSLNSAHLPTLGGGIHNRQVNPGIATTSLGSTILKKGAGGANLVNDTGTITSQGFNISSDPPTGPYLNQSTDRTNLDPMIATLGLNGGPTQTCALLAGSPAFDQGKNLSALASDQRGLLRTADAGQVTNATGGDGTDVGAVEINPFAGVVDSDGDGMPDEFEIFFGISDPNADSDGDGLTNLQEYQAGTNPLDPASSLRITSVEENGTDFIVTCKTAIAGKKYRLERRDSLLPSDTWGSITGLADLVPVTTGTTSITDPGGATGAKRFYRITVVP